MASLFPSLRRASRKPWGIRARLHDAVEEELGGALRVIRLDASRPSEDMPGEAYDRVVLYFALHGIPEARRRHALREAYRVARPGGRIVIVDYHRPDASLPLRPAIRALLRIFRPAALELWNRDIAHWLPRFVLDREVRKETLCGGLFQKLVVAA